MSRTAAAEETGIDAEVIDLRTLVPLDIETIVASVQKTGRCVIVHEATRTSRLRRRAVGAGAGALLLSPGGADRARTGWDTPYPHAFEWEYFPGPGARRRGDAPRDGGLSMGRYVFKLPDVGEGTAEAEIVAWHVKVGDVVTEDQNLVDVMTDKATVEMTSPVAGKVDALHGEPGDVRAVAEPFWSCSRPRAMAPRSRPTTGSGRSLRLPHDAQRRPAGGRRSRRARPTSRLRRSTGRTRSTVGAPAGRAGGARHGRSARRRPARPCRDGTRRPHRPRRSRRAISPAAAARRTAGRDAGPASEDVEPVRGCAARSPSG